MQQLRSAEVTTVARRVAALYDIHGNLPALDAVLADVRAGDFDLIVIGGDVVPGPMPVECIERIASLDIPTVCIHGNGEREIIAYARGVESETVPAEFRESMRWVSRQLTDDQRRWIESWPANLEIEIGTLGRTFFCHATARNDTEIITRNSDVGVLRSVFTGTTASTIVCGHTHMQFDRMFDDRRLVNAGSVGMPFGEPGAYWLALGERVEPRCTQYDARAAAARIRATVSPDAERFSAQNLLSRPSERQMLEIFERVSVRS